MNSRKAINAKRTRRANRTRSRILGTAESPRAAVFRSNSYVSVQLIDDSAHKTLFSATSRNLGKEAEKKTKIEQAGLVGQAVAKAALAKGVKRAVFDRRSYAFHGRVKALAEGMRQGGLKI